METTSIWTPEEIAAREQTAAAVAYLVEYDDGEEPETITDLETALRRARRYHGRVLPLVANGQPALADYTGASA